MIDTGLLYLAVGAPTGDDGAFRAIGREVAAAFAAAGFQVEWDDNPDARIGLRNITWQRRRAT